MADEDLLGLKESYTVAKSLTTGPKDTHVGIRY